MLTVIVPLRLQGTTEAARPGTLLGRVLAPDGSGAVAQVELWHPGRGQRARYRTAGDGSFRLERIPAGSLRLAVRHDRFAADPPRTVDLPPGGVLDLGALNLQPGFVIHGALRGPDDQALPQVTVCVRQGGREVGYAAVAADGSYRCPPLRPGDYTLQVQAEGLAPGFAAVTLDAADRLLDLRLTWGIPVHALVQAADGPAGRWTSLRVLDERNQPLHDAGLPMADRTTRYPLWLAPGRYRAFAADDLGHRAAAEWTIVQGQSPAPLLLQLR